MKVRIGITDTNKVVEIEVDDHETFQSEVERSMSESELAWFTDVKGRLVGIPTRAIAFVEIEPEDSLPSVGFAPAM
jgi:hypothetical protein